MVTQIEHSIGGLTIKPKCPIAPLTEPPAIYP